MKIKDMKMSKDISITAIATDEEIHQLWEIVGKIVDRSKLDGDGELIVKIREWDYRDDITTEQVSEWVGNGFEDSREEAFIEIITDVANGKYDIAELNSDIRSYE